MPTARGGEGRAGRARILYWNVENRSAAKLKGKDRVAVHAHAEHPSTEELCVAFAAHTIKKPARIYGRALQANDNSPSGYF